MSTPWQRWGWPLVKLVLAAMLLAAVGWQFTRDLRKLNLDDLAWRPHWLALSALLYLVFLGSSCWYWRRLLRHFGADAPAHAVTRAYFVSQLGKYVPGKAWALLLRGGMVRGPRLRFGLAILTSFYEVMTTMAAGALVAAIAFAIEPPVVRGWEIAPVLLGVILLGVCGVPLLPTVFNRVAARLATKVSMAEAGPLPTIDFVTLLQGLAISACGWCVLGVSVWSGLAAVLSEPPPLDVSVGLRCLGAIGLAYVGGFLAVFMPAGVAAREIVLLELLAFAGPEAGPEAPIAAAVLLMRLAWTGAEILLAGALYPWRAAVAQET
ncbi:MAG: flippase-like domain-containing protein [Gemmataceae bacterium]|nr:flippase-like domain-containing protein [Gemmataceae bacterium]